MTGPRNTPGSEPLFMPIPSVGMAPEKQRALRDESQAMRNPLPSAFREGYAIFASPVAIAAELRAAQLKARVLAQEIAWLEELHAMRIAQMDGGRWP